ncbi:uncharacterized protein K460DRAFT_122690 [Cucurbitaria berberidis CBS 394.84]|uniref:F-box domain-containing protein n=1 Tax=Cucurbitaria berberidis CBS 394.84 TaxID=1168544 RepID=A0A9P4GIJ4_9PLEO|nr:uncharacterized protein K460DRAFT_122690 [Cucurbitaria berberidis CBS 394.84]KAF1846287.1 hypothetical protein K460DRAFT_122690 [Cucurbitaria berberidis CBS 394.84]
MFFLKSPPPPSPLVSSSTPPPLPPRKPCTGTCNQQSQSVFFAKLPPEIRNEIYQYAFSLDASESISAVHHPLSLLLTCHQINHEATNLAFNTHAFAIKPNARTSFVALRDKTSHLSAQQTFAITTLSYDLVEGYIKGGSAVANMLANGILVFPFLSRIEIYIQRGYKSRHKTHYYPFYPAQDRPFFNDPRKDAIEKYAPIWLDYKILRPVARGHTFSWQAGQKWSIAWPQLDTPYFSVIGGEDSNGESLNKPYMGTDAVGAARGVHMCICGCGEVCWLSADLVQQTGRRVLVDTYFYGAEVIPRTDDERRFGHLKVRLHPGVPGVEGLTRENVGATSFKNEVDEEYWDELRRRNGKLDALWRGFWRGSRAGKEAGRGEGNSSLPLE